MLTYILSQPKMTEEVAAEGPYAVIMAPTRELAQQVGTPSIQNLHHVKYHWQASAVVSL